MGLYTRQRVEGQELSLGITQRQVCGGYSLSRNSLFVLERYVRAMLVFFRLFRN